LAKLDRESKDRKTELERLIAWAKAKKRPYDCVVPLSGGKDSVYVLYLCEMVYGMKSLAITFDNGLLSDYAKNNINNAIRSTGADHIYFGPNPNEMMELYRISLERTGVFCIPCMRGIELVSKMGADMFNIPLIIKGTGQRYSYLSRIPELFQNGDPDFFSRVFDGQRTSYNIKGLKEFKVKWDLSRIVHIFTSLLGLPDPTTPRHISIYDYLGPSFKEIEDTIKKEMNWTRPEDQTEHMDCKASKIAIYLHSKKADGLSDSTCKNSSLIRLGLMSRKDALDYDEKYIKDRKDPTNLIWFLDQINMTREEFEKNITDWNKLDRFRKNGQTLLERTYIRFIERG